MDATHVQEGDRVRSRDHPRGTWVGLLAVLILAALPLLAASTFSAPVAQTMHPVSYLPLVKGPPYYPIAFTSGRDMDPNEYFMRTEIYVMNADGSSQTRLTYNYNPSQAYTPVWSPDGRQIAFGASLNGDPDIYVMNADGSNRTNLTNNPARGEGPPVWSPDGRQIAFDSYPYSDSIDDIYVMNPDGSNQTNLTKNLGNDAYPVWSPDGHRIAFVSFTYWHADIYVMNADGSHQTNLAFYDFDGNCGTTGLVWSPDGKRIAFTPTHSTPAASCISDIYVMNADGSNQTNLTTSPGSDGSPVWSPDGHQIVFASDRDGNWEIYVMNADGSSQTNLTKNPASDGSPVWSPDGRRIAFYSDRDGNGEIYVMNADGSSQTNLTKNPASDGSPVWSPTIN